MKHLPTNPLQPMPLRSMKISTNIRLHPEFSKAPVAFAHQRGVDIVDDVFPETSFRKDTDSEDTYRQEKIEKAKLNIHLVRYGAIRLLAERDDEEYWVRSIKLNPSLLLYEAERHPLLHSDLVLSLSILSAKVTPLLAEPFDARHIVPGLVSDEEPIAYWSAIRGEILLPSILLRSLHCLSHPMTGPAVGATKTRIQLGNKKDDCVIRFESSQWEASGPDGSQTVHGVRVTLFLKGRPLTAEFGQFGTTTLVKDIERLTAIPASAVARVHQTMMSRLEGTYLPVPPEWSDRSQGKSHTHAKAIALLSHLTSVPLEELRSLDEEPRKPSKSTRQRLDKDVPIEAARLTPLPVSTLFESAVYSAPEPGRSSQDDQRVDPQITEVYGVSSPARNYSGDAEYRGTEHRGKSVRRAKPEGRIYPAQQFRRAKPFGTAVL
jgi:hypothetical protein